MFFTLFMKVPHEAKKVFNGILFDVYQWKQKVFDGSIDIYEMVGTKPSNSIIAITGKKIIVLDQEQPGTKPFVSLPGGRTEEGENEKLAAKRELLEETGYVSEEFELWFTANEHTKIDAESDIWIAKNCKRTSEQSLDKGEKIKVNLIEFDNFLNLVRDENFRIPTKLRHELWLMLVDENKKTEFRKKLGL